VEALSEINGTRRLPAPIRVQPYHGDHCFDGKPVLSAVEAMAALAASVRVHYPQVDCRTMADARFDRFAFLPPAPAVVDTFHELDAAAGGRVRAQLITRQRGKASAMTRTKHHACLLFGSDQRPFGGPRPPMPGGGFKIAADRLYRDLVPFGPAFQTIIGQVALSAAGAVARVRNPGKVPVASPLGAALLLDGAFHAACAWGQRHAAMVAFPVGFARRRIIKRPLAGAACEAHIFADADPANSVQGGLTFDIQIYDEDQKLCEVVEGLAMRDVSRGRLQPPAWVRG
jgi:hypothetical protein